MDKTRRQKLVTWTGFAVLSLVALGGSASAVIVDQRSDQVAACSDQAFNQTNTALNKRDAYLDSLTQRTLDMWDAQEELLETPRNASDEDRQAAIDRYKNALHKYTDAQRKAAKTRDAAPYAPVDSIKNCRENIEVTPFGF